MQRLLSLFLLISLLPRLVFAVPTQETLCFGADHLSTSCHEAGSVDACPTSPSDDPATPSEDGCVDVSTDSTPVRAHESAPPLLMSVPPDFATPLCFEIVTAPHADFAAALSAPHSFDARDFSCSIAPRC